MMCMYFTKGIKKKGHMLCMECKKKKNMHPIFTYIYNKTSQCDDIILLIQDYIKVDRQTFDCGYVHCVTLLQNNTIKCNGDDDFGQCDVPDSIQGKVIEISCGSYYSCALLEDNTIKFWGEYNWLFDIPPSIQGMVVSIGCGKDYMCALLNDNTVKCWGCNDRGQCKPPASIQGNVVSLKCDFFNPCVYLNDGTKISW